MKLKPVIKRFVNQRFRSSARIYRKFRGEDWFAGLKEASTSRGLTLIAEPGLSNAITRSNEIPVLETLLADGCVCVDVDAHQHGATDRYSKTLATLQRQSRSVRLLDHVRPNILAAPFYKLVLPSQRRGIVVVEGVRLYLDPGSHLGHTVLKTGAYEPETVSILREHIKPGDVFLDIGANEGVMGAFAASLVGQTGYILAVEPQSRLLDVLEINLALNCTGMYHLVHGAVSDHDAPVTVSLGIEGNTGASSIVNSYRWTTKKESVRAYSIESLAKLHGLTSIDFVKIDVEGYEPEVLRSLLESRQKIGKVLVDYHASILSERGINLISLHSDMLKGGYKTLCGSLSGGYVLYAK